MEHALMHIEIPRSKEHSARCPISRLPYETLAEIFRLDTLPDDTRNSFRFDTLFKCTQVCRYWRRVAFECANLWTHIESPEDWASSPEWIRFLLARSKSAPLYLSFNTSWSSSSRRSIQNGNTLQENVLSALEQMHRVKSLNVSGNAKSLASLFPSIFGSPAFLLESLSIESNGYIQLVLPDPLFAFTSSQLRRLRLNRCEVHWNSPVLSSGMLTHLEISYWIPSKNTLSFSELLTILRSSPGLQELILSLYDFVALLEAPSQIILLPHLSAIKLTGLLLDCASLLLHIAYPRNILICLVCNIAGPEVDISGAMDVFGTKGLRGVGEQKSVYLDADIDHLRWSVAQVGVSSQSYILLRWVDFDPSDDISGLVLSIWRAVRDDHIVEFGQNIYSMIVSEEVVREVLRGLGAVTKIIFEGLSRNFLTVLFQRRMTNVDTYPFCLPFLREIIFSGLHLSARLSDSHPESVSKALCDYLAKRFDAGCGIESVIFDNPPHSSLNFTIDQMHLLRSVVPRLQVTHSNDDFMMGPK